MCVMAVTKCVIVLAVASGLLVGETSSMSRQRRLDLAEEAKDMFYHGESPHILLYTVDLTYYCFTGVPRQFSGYDAYMDNAFPADELMPLSCQGRFRGVQPDRGDLDDALGK